MRKKDELNNEWEVVDVHKTVILLMHCWIKLWDSLKPAVTCALCVNGFQKQLEILMKGSSAARVDWTISRIENKMIIKKKPLYQLWKSINWSLGCGSVSFFWLFFLFLVTSGHSQNNGLVGSHECLAGPEQLWSGLGNLGRSVASLLLKAWFNSEQVAWDFVNLETFHGRVEISLPLFAPVVLLIYPLRDFFFLWAVGVFFCLGFLRVFCLFLFVSSSVWKCRVLAYGTF